MKFNSHAGHGKQDSKSCGASKIVKESVENRFLNEEVINLLKKEGHIVHDCTIDYPASKNDCLNKIIAKCNQNKVDLDISHHLNSGRSDLNGDGSIGGVEVWVYSKTSKAYEPAVRVCKELEKLGFKNRGVKIKPDYSILKNTNSPAMIIEYFFVDDKDDCNLYNKLGYKSLAKAVVQGILNKEINTDNTNVINANNTTTTKYTNCILYGNDIDKVSAEVLGWAKNDCIVKNVKDHIAWEGSNLFVIGGSAKNELEKMNTGENYASIVGTNRFDTVIQVLKILGKL